jgi:hypothetical protein
MTTQIVPPASAHPAGDLTLSRTGLPRAGSRNDGVAPLLDNRAQLLHLVLFVAGAVLLPAGLVVIGLGWYGAAHTPYQYDQMSYLISGGILGLGITFVGGFLYFGAWLARVAADQKDAAKRLSDTLLLLADAVSHANATAAMAHAGVPAATAPATAAPLPPPPPSALRDPGSVLVVAGNGSTVHRADCDLIADRDDLRPAGPDAPGLTACRLCAPITGR